MTERHHLALAELRAIDPEVTSRAGRAHGTFEAPDETLLVAILDTGRRPPETTTAGVGTRGKPEEFHFKRASTRWAVPLGISAVVVALIVALVVVLPPGPAVKHVATVPKRPSTTWRLAAALTGPQFHIATGTPDLITGASCTTRGVCFLSTDYGLDYNGGGSLFLSRDGGHTWSPVTLPADTAITTRVSCASSAWCAVGAGRLDPTLGDPLAKKPMRAPELLITTDGGATWTPQPVPLHVTAESIPAGGGFPAETTYWPGSIDAVSCNVVRSCQVLGQAQIDGPGVLDRLFYLNTTDAGQHWSSVQLPERASEAANQIVMQAGNSVSMDCPSVASCVVVASLVGFPQPPVDSWSTDNGGTSWLERSVPGINYLSSPLSCPVADNCWLTSQSGNTVLHTVDGGTTWSPVVVPAGDTQAISCSSASDCWASGTGIAATTDAGRQWTSQALPAPAGLVPQISCSDRGECVATAIASTRGFTIDNDGSLILTNAPVGATR